MTTPRDNLTLIANLNGAAPDHSSVVVRLGDLRALLDATKPKEPKPRRPPTAQLARILRVVPHYGESISPTEVAQRLEMKTGNVCQMMWRAEKMGFLVRIREGAYSLPESK